MRRRDFIKVIVGSAAAWPLPARATAAKLPTIGVLWHAGSVEQERPYYVGLLEGFKEVGYVEGSNIKFEHRFPNEKPELFKSFAAELVGLNVDVLVTVGPQTAHYASDATANNPIPVVFIFVPDPVGSGLAESLARPGKNITGLSNFGADLVGKRLQLLKEMIPALSRVAVLVNPNTPDSGLYIRVTQAAAEVLKLTSYRFEARSPDELEGAFDAMATAHMEAAVLCNAQPLFRFNGALLELSLRASLFFVVRSW
jgi:putative tryptophan/tyrosine transport system substrate-binding protein